MLLRMLETAMHAGGPARARELLDLRLRRQASDASNALLLALQEHLNANRERHSGDNATGRAPGAQRAGEAPGALGRSQRDDGDAASAIGRSGSEILGAPLGPNSEGNAAAVGAPAGAVQAGSVGATAPASTPTGPDTQITPTPESPDVAGRRPSRQSTPPSSRPTGGPTPAVINRGIAAQTAQRQLPFTGVDVPVIAFLGVATLATGVLLRRRATAAR
jgi:hypothetical protein